MIQTINKYWLNSFVGACILLVLAIDVQAQNLNTTWERSARTGAADVAPAWFTVGSVRGMAYGTVGGNERVYAADRANTTIRVMDAATGADVTPATAFDLAGVGGGTFAMNDVEVSDDGVIFLGNLTTDAAASPFRLYWWTSEGGAYADSLTITTATAQRLGDKFTVKGSVSDNSIEVWVPAASSDPGIVHVLTTTDNGATWDVDTITLSGSNTSIPANSDATPLELGRAGDFYIVGNGTSPKRYDSTGAYVADSQFPVSDYTGSRNGLSSFMLDGESHLSVYTYRPDGTDTGNKTGQVYIYNVSDTTSPVTVGESPLMGDDADTFSSIHGEANVRVNMDGSVDVFAMDGVNGFVAYNFDPNRPSMAAPVPTEDAARVISLFSDAYTDVTVDTWRTDWSAADFADDTVAGNAVKRYTNLDFVGIETVANQVDISAMTNFRFDIWTPNATTFRAKLVDFGANGAFGDGMGNAGGDDTEAEVADTTIAMMQGKWVSVDIPLSEFAAMTGRENFAQLIFSALPTAQTTVFIDNIFFYEVEKFDVTFQADMSGFIDSAAFVPGEDYVTVAGSMNGWDASADTLTDDNQDGIYTKTLRLPADTYFYKFVVDAGRITGGYEDGDNREVVVTADVVIEADEPNVPYSDLTNATFGEVQLFFQVNMEVQTISGNFDPNNSEHNVVVAGGFNGWSTTANPLTPGQTEGVYETTITINPAAVPQSWAYKFVLNNGETVWESGADKIIEVTEANLFEGKYVAVNNTGTAPFFDGITLDDIFAEETTVAFEVDLRPAFYFLADSSKLPNDVQTGGGGTTSIDFLIGNGPLIAGTWETWGADLGNDATIVFTDDGQDGDLVAGDTVYTLNKTFAAGAAKQGAFKLGVNGDDNEGGFGADHNIRVESDRVSLIFGAVIRADSVYDDLYDPYILATESGPVVVRRGGEGDNGVIIPTETLDEPGRFALDQNYPNPFNPTTTINFTLAQSSQVTLKVYNLLGQEVATLVNGRLGSGPHSVQFNASGLSSGMYLYRIEAGSFVQNKKMMLIK